MRLKINQHYFILGLISLCCFYLGFEFFFNAYSMVSVDEFWYAHNAYHYKNALPYRDFAPYKTILGYYILLIPMLITNGILPTLIFTKNVIAILNVLILFISSFWLLRFFSKSAVLISLAILISSDIVLSFSTNIRVDLLSYWFCFFSLLCLLEKRYLLAGFLIGLGFITSQKAVWYIFASNCALMIGWIIAYTSHFKTKEISIKNIIQFNLALAFVILAYITTWSFISDWHTVTKSIFNEGFAIYQIDTYNNERMLYWTYTLLYNPILFFLWPLTLISIFITYPNDTSYRYRFFLTIYAFTILGCLIPYKQVFPYYMQVTIPILFILYAAFFTWFIGLFQKNEVLQIKWIGKTGVWILLFCYNIIVVSLIWYFKLPTIYLFISIIPLLLCLFEMKYKKMSPGYQTAYLITLSFMLFLSGILYPLTFSADKLIYLDGAYQKANLRVVNRLLEDGSDYIAGIELIYNKNQTIPGLRHLMAPAIFYLYSPSSKLKKVMLSSLYEDPNATIQSVIIALQKSSVKFYVNNYRVRSLPIKIRNFLNKNYEHCWGSIYLYAPKVEADKEHFNLKFSGRYQLLTNSDTVNLNGKIFRANSITYLVKGNYVSHAKKSYRLKLIPKEDALFDAHFQNDNWEKIIF